MSFPAMIVSMFKLDGVPKSNSLPAWLPLPNPGVVPMAPTFSMLELGELRLKSEVIFAPGDVRSGGLVD